MTQLLVLRPWWSEHDRFWVTFGKPDAIASLERERRYWCHYPTNRNAVNLIKNLFLAARICRRERPTIIVSTGAAIAVPFFYVGKLLGTQNVFIEVVDRLDGPTLTGRLVRPVTDRYLVQWEEQRRFYPLSRTRVIGRLL